MLNRMIIDHASPTLARLRMGNLFNHTIGEGFPIEFAELSGQLQDKGVTSARRFRHSGAMKSANRSIKGCLRQAVRCRD